MRALSRLGGQLLSRATQASLAPRRGVAALQASALGAALQAAPRPAAAAAPRLSLVSRLGALGTATIGGELDLTEASFPIDDL